MTGTGDGLKPESLNELLAAAAAEEEVTLEPSSPLGGSLTELMGVSDGSVLNEELASDPGSTTSIFDEVVDAPIRSMDEIPDLIPNISDGGTEILAKGRAEIQEFVEEFGGDIDQAGAVDDREGPFDAHPNALGGFLLNDLDHAEESSGEAHSTQESPTVIMGRQEHELRGHELSSEPPPEEFSASGETVSVSGESGILDLESLSNDTNEARGADTLSAENSGLSLDEITAATASVAVVGAVPRAASTPAPAGNRTLLIALGGYAAVVTLLCVILLSLLGKARSGGQLESLPDVAPEPAGKMSLTPANAQLPPGHLLSLGHSERYGHVRVEPLRVTRGPLHFVYAGTQGEQGFKTDPVLKLWVRLTNESTDQSIVPLDSKLLFRRSKDNLRANNFVVQKADQGEGAPLVMIHYDALLNRQDWSLEGQHLGKLLQPGESIETYLPTTEDGVDQLSGELIWRIHLRKGHSPSGNGVTTLVEVTFRDDQIESEGT